MYREASGDGRDARRTVPRRKPLGGYDTGVPVAGPVVIVIFSDIDELTTFATLKCVVCMH